MKKNRMKEPGRGATHARRWSALVAGLLLLVTVFANGQRASVSLQKDLKKDFGAVGDGRTNDQAAFVKAADFFNKRAQTPTGAAPAVLLIPKGVYLVGQQDAAGNGATVLHLVGCRNLTIQGADSANTEIRYADGLRYGSFDPTTKMPYEAPAAFFTDPNYAARVGTCIVLQNCDRVDITGLMLNGNSAKLVVGGHWGDTGIQLPADGIFITDSRRIALRRLAVHHFGRDGIQVLNHLAKALDSPEREDILLENSTCNYNGRQGLSITGVNGLRAVNCSFSHTGRVIIPALGRTLYSNPGAGVDVEPEGGYAANVRLENCRFVDNAGQGIVSDRYGNGPPTTKNVVISGGLLWGVTNWAAWVRQTGFLFENCRIYGSFVTGCALVDYATRFIDCTFEDRPYHGQPAYGQFLLNSSNEARRMRFTNCRFVGTRNYLLLASPAGLADTASRFRLQGCIFVLDQAEPPVGAANELAGSVFSGVTTVAAGPHRTTSAPIGFWFGSRAAPGSTAVLPGGHLRLLAPGGRYVLLNGLDIGRPPGRKPASVVVGDDNDLILNKLTNSVPELYIGPRACLHIKKGGTLELQPHTKVTIAGQLILDDGAYLVRDAQAELVTIGRGQLRIGRGTYRYGSPTAQPEPVGVGR